MFFTVWYEYSDLSKGFEYFLHHCCWVSEMNNTFQYFILTKGAECTWVGEHHGRDGDDNQQDDKSNSHSYHYQVLLCEKAQIKVLLSLLSWVQTWMARLRSRPGGTQQNTEELITHPPMQSHEPHFAFKKKYSVVSSGVICSRTQITPRL